MTLVSVFVMNLLCAMVPCDPINPLPEIEGASNSVRSFVREKRLISEKDYPVVETRNGKVKGYPMMVMSGRKIFAFEGIKYADVPGRFEASIPSKNWTGVRTAFQPGPYCLQMHLGKMFRVVGSEDCLFLNVYSPLIPSGNSNKTLPVIVFIHGGSFAFGAGAELGPSYLLEKDVILVTLNYRLGVLGFLSTGDEVIPGNNGLKDQAIALKWVHENIQAFGGDNAQVTLMGQSAGAVSTHLHMMSTSTRKYFQRAVLLSGTAHTHWGIQNSTQALRWTKDLARLVNCPSDKGSQEIVTCLRKKDPNWVVAAQMNLFEWIPFPPVLFAPVIEPPSASAFITEDPEVISASGREAAIPTIFSVTSEEGFLANYVLNMMMKIGPFINDVKKYLPYYLDYHYITGDLQEQQITEKVLKFYLGNNVNPRNVNEYGKMGTDRMFAVSINKAVKYHAKVAPTYASLFSFFGKYNIGKSLGVPKNELGVAHTEDLFYYFNSSLYIQGFQQKDREAELSKIVVNLLTNFASKGEPLYTDKSSGQEKRIWDAVNPTDQEIQMLQLDEDVRMIDDPFVTRRTFWENLGLEDMQPIIPQLSTNSSIQLVQS